MVKTTKTKTANDVPHFAIRIMKHTAIEGDNCPRCGASGKYVTYVLCSDGRIRGAMRGCLKGAFILPKELEQFLRIETAMRKIKADSGKEWIKGKILLDNLEADIYRQAERYNATYGITGLPAREHQHQPQPHPKSDRTGTCVAGKQTIKGTVTKLKVVDTGFGELLKMTVHTEGDVAIYGSVPSAIYDVKVGDMVQFNADVQVSTTDSTFGFFKRPTKAQVLVPATA
jgi:hypothetical protein